MSPGPIVKHFLEASPTCRIGMRMPIGLLHLAVSAYLLGIAPAHADAVLWSRNIISFNDPATIQTKTDCIGWFVTKTPFGKKFKTCSEWAPRKRYQKVKIWVEVRGPQSVQSVVVNAARNCGAVAFTAGNGAGLAASNAATPAAYVPAFWGTFKTSFWGCITSWKAASGLLRVRMPQERHWTGWH